MPICHHYLSSDKNNERNRPTTAISNQNENSTSMLSAPPPLSNVLPSQSLALQQPFDPVFPPPWIYSQQRPLYPFMCPASVVGGAARAANPFFPSMYSQQQLQFVGGAAPTTNPFGFASTGGVVVSVPRILASIDEGGPHDVFISLANAAKNAPGTVALQVLVREYKQRFEIAVTKTTGQHAIFSTTVTQASVSREIFSEVQKRGGRFYCRHRGSDVWEEATNADAISYIRKQYYRQSEHVKAVRKECQRKYQQSEHGKAHKRDYKQALDNGKHGGKVTLPRRLWHMIPETLHKYLEDGEAE